MSVTRSEIATRALRRCGRLSYNETANATLNADALQAYDETYAEFEEKGIVDWGSTAAVPNEYVFWVVARTAYNLCDQLGVSGERFKRISRDSDRAEQELKRIYHDPYTPNEIRVPDY